METEIKKKIAWRFLEKYTANEVYVKNKMCFDS